MFKFLALFASLVSIAAFAPVRQMRPSSVMKMAFKDAIGAQAPLGFWDPLGLLKNADQERFDRLRTVEIKHGRIAMLAILGHIVTTKGDRWPAEPFASAKTGLAAITSLPDDWIYGTVAFIGLMEWGFGNAKEGIEEYCDGYMDDYKMNKKSKMAIELNNGRAAQMGILGLMVHEKLDNNPYILNSLLGSPVTFN